MRKSSTRKKSVPESSTSLNKTSSNALPPVIRKTGATAAHLSLEPPVLCLKGCVIVIFIIVGTTFQSAFVKTVYNVPFATVEASFNDTFCLSGKCSISPDLKSIEVGSTIFWSLTAVAEPLGSIPAFLSGRYMVEKYGRCTTMIYASVPLTAGLLLQGLSSQMRAPIFLLIGRLFHSFGTTWLLVAGIVYSSDLLISRIKQQTIYSVLAISLAACFVVVQILGLPQVLGTLNRWGLLYVVAGGVLAFLLLVVILVPDSPRYLDLISDMSNLQKSLTFYYEGEITIQKYKVYMLSESIAGADRQISLSEKESYSILEFIQKKSAAKQMKHIYLIILCEILKHMIMSSAILLFSTTVVRQSMGFNVNSANFVNLATISCFLGGFVFCFLGFMVIRNREKVTVTVVCLLLVIFAYSCLAVLGFTSKFFPKNYLAFRYLTLACLFILFATYNLGLVTVAETVICNRILSTAGQVPMLTLARCIARFFELLIAASFFPVLRFEGPGLAWLVIVIPLVVCLPLLLSWMPKASRQMETLTGKLPLGMLFSPDKSSSIQSRFKSWSYAANNGEGSTKEEGTSTNFSEHIQPGRKKSASSAPEVQRKFSEPARMQAESADTRRFKSSAKGRKATLTAESAVAVDSLTVESSDGNRSKSPKGHRKASLAADFVTGESNETKKSKLPKPFKKTK